MGNSASRRAKIIIPPPAETFLESRRTGHHVHFHPATKHKYPLSALYSIYGAIMTGNREQVRATIDSFFEESKWAVSSIDDPHDTDDKRHAVIAAVTYLLVDLFNGVVQAGPPKNAAGGEEAKKLEAALKKRKKKPLQAVPKWAADYPALGETLVVPDGQERVPSGKDDPEADPWMLKKNILTYKLPTDLFGATAGS